MHLFFAIAATINTASSDTLTTTVTDTTWYVTKPGARGERLRAGHHRQRRYGYVVVRYRERRDRVALDPWGEGSSGRCRARAAHASRVPCARRRGEQAIQRPG